MLLMLLALRSSVRVGQALEVLERIDAADAGPPDQAPEHIEAAGLGPAEIERQVSQALEGSEHIEAVNAAYVKV
jgi:hypothetical protein